MLNGGFTTVKGDMMQTNVVHADTREMTHEDWLESRRHGIGGSDAGAILGVSKWGSPLTVWMEKMGKAPVKEPNEAMRQGTDLEPYVVKRFVELMREEEGIDIKVRRCNKILKHPTKPWMLANIDRDIVGMDAGLECKTTSPMTKCDYEGGEIPPQYYAQIQHYMAVTGASHWYLAVLIYSKKFHVINVPRDDNYIDVLIQREEDFWNNYVMKGIAPFPTGVESEPDMITALYPMVTSSEEVDLSDIKDTLVLLDMQRQAKKRIEDDIAELEGRIKMALGEKSRGMTDDYRVTWSQYTSSSLDKKKMLEDHPELEPIIAQYTTTKPSRKFLFKAVGK